MKKGKGKPRREREDFFDKPDFTLGPGSHMKSGPEKSVTVFIVCLDLVSKRILSCYKIDDPIPNWVLPSERMEKGETPPEAAWRAAYNEAGYKLPCVIDERTKEFKGLATAELVTVYEVNPTHEKHLFVDIINPETIGEMTIREKDEIEKVSWLTLDEWINIPPVPYNIQEAVRGREYKKETHLEMIITALKFLDLLEEFGFREASVDDYIAGYVPACDGDDG